MRRMLPGAALVVALAWPLACAPEVRAQSKESEPAPAATQREGAPSPPEQTSAALRWFTIRLGAVALVDYGSFRQDASSLAQVGRQSNRSDLARPASPTAS